MVQWLKYRLISISPINTSIANAGKPRAAPVATDRDMVPIGTHTGVKALACVPPTSAKRSPLNRHPHKHLPANHVRIGAMENTPSLPTRLSQHRPVTRIHRRARNKLSYRPSLNKPVVSFSKCDRPFLAQPSRPPLSTENFTCWRRARDGSSISTTCLPTSCSTMLQ